MPAGTCHLPGKILDRDLPKSVLYVSGRRPLTCWSDLWIPYYKVSDTFLRTFQVVSDVQEARPRARVGWDGAFALERRRGLKQPQGAFLQRV